MPTIRPAIAAAMLLVPPAVRGQAASPASSASSASSASLYALPLRFTARDGTSRDLASLRGAPVVIAMAYFSCTMTCPLITSELQAVQATLPPVSRARTQFVLVSFDPVRDSAPAARAFAERMKLDGHWHVLTGSPAAVRRLSVLLGVSYRPLPSGDFDHSNQITVLDVDGVQRHQEVRIPPDRTRLARAIIAVAPPR